LATLSALIVADARPAQTSASRWVNHGPVEPLDAREEGSPAALALARRFNPAMALTEVDGLTPVAVSYAWSGGSDLMGRAVAADGRTVRDTVIRKSGELDRVRWDNLPLRDGDGNRMEYWVDAPGDDRRADGMSSWRRSWQQARAARPETTTPTQYAHLFWLDRAAGVLVIQYWFYYPYNEWINHHEGDWEHINVVLQGTCGHLSKVDSTSPGRPTKVDSDRGACRVDEGGDFKPVDYEFYFHRFRVDTSHPVRAEGAGDHAVVYVGGRAQLWWWSGDQSGGSYPMPAHYPGAGFGAGPFDVGDDTRTPARTIPASAFNVVLLPEPERLDAAKNPELSWLKLPFFAGQQRVHRNPPFIDRFGGGKAPEQPGRRRAWNALATRPLWTGEPVRRTETLVATTLP
jgi:hypothetical protein